MVNVTKQEVTKLREAFPDLHVTRTVHKYYVEESLRVMKLLREIRGNGGRHA